MSDCSMKVIRDVVHGYIELCKNDLEIIDTPHFQRLKSVRQNNPFSVYPCANHTRFEHSLGVMHLGAKVFESLNEKRMRNGEPPFDEKLKATRKIRMSAPRRWTCSLLSLWRTIFQ